jgi:hypothetical protein
MEEPQNLEVKLSLPTTHTASVAMLDSGILFMTTFLKKEDGSIVAYRTEVKPTDDGKNVESKIVSVLDPTEYNPEEIEWEPVTEKAPLKQNTNF